MENDNSSSAGSFFAFCARSAAIVVAKNSHSDALAVVRRVNVPDPDYRIRRMDFNLIGLEVRHSCDRVSELRSCRPIRQNMLFRRLLGSNCGNIPTATIPMASAATMRRFNILISHRNGAPMT